MYTVFFPFSVAPTRSTPPDLMSPCACSSNLNLITGAHSVTGQSYWTARLQKEKRYVWLSMETVGSGDKAELPPRRQLHDSLHLDRRSQWIDCLSMNYFVNELDLHTLTYCWQDYNCPPFMIPFNYLTNLEVKTVLIEQILLSPLWSDWCVCVVAMHFRKTFISYLDN